MPAQLTWDLATGFGAFAASNDGGWDRPYKITGAGEADPTDIAAIIGEALDLLPPLGTVAASPLAGLQVTRKVVDAIEPELAADGTPSGTVRVNGRVIYTLINTSTAVPVPPDNSQPALSLSLQSLTEDYETRSDIGGVRLTVEDSDGQVRGVTLSVPRPRTRFIAVRPEIDFPRARKDTYEGHVNDAPWNGWDAGVVLCESIEAVSQNGGQSWSVQYVFATKPEGWNGVEIVGEDLETGRPIAAPTGAQIKTVDVYPEASFAALNITFPT